MSLEVWTPPEELRKYVMSIEELMNEETSPTKWIVPGIVAEGLTILASKPKVGKSTLSLDMSVAVAKKERMFGIDGYSMIEGRTLYIALDDTAKNRAQERLEKRLGGRKDLPRVMNYSVRWPRQNEDGLKLLEMFITSSPEPVQLIVIDVLQKFLPPYREDSSAYQALQEYLPPVRNLAQKHHV